MTELLLSLLGILATLWGLAHVAGWLGELWIRLHGGKP